MFLNYKHARDGHVISAADYARLKSLHQKNYYETMESATHEISDEDLIIALAVTDMSQEFETSSPADLPSGNGTDSNFDFGGGDSGGAGASENY